MVYSLCYLLFFTQSVSITSLFAVLSIFRLYCDAFLLLKIVMADDWSEMIFDLRYTTNFTVENLDRYSRGMSNM